MSQLKILIVEDDPDVGRAMALRLKRAGFQVVVARDAYQASLDVMPEHRSARVGIGLTRLGTSEALSIGAYAYALNKLNPM